MKPEWETSATLKKIFNEEFELWRKKHRGSLEELANRIGVSPSYLGHIGRYGRIPGRPILILLALNFELADPKALFEAAGLKTDWPFAGPGRIAELDEAKNSVLSVKFDMANFTEIIRDVVRSEIRPRSLVDLTKGRPLRVGLNVHQGWLFDALFADPETETVASEKGVFPEILRLIGISAKAKLDIEAVRYSEFEEALREGRIDVFGPIYITHKRVTSALYTAPFCDVGISALVRKREAKYLPVLPLPKSLEDLRDPRCAISVLKDSHAHHFADITLGRSDSSLLLCETAGEALERIVLANIKSPAHLMLCDTPLALAYREHHKGELDLLTFGEDAVLGMCRDTLAVRPDWPELVTVLNDTILFLQRSGAIQKIFQDRLPEEVRQALSF